MPVVSSSVRRPSLTWRELEINVVIAESAEDTKKKKGRGIFLFHGNDTFLLERAVEGILEVLDDKQEVSVIHHCDPG